MAILWLGNVHPQEVDEPPPSIAPPPLTPGNIAGVLSQKRQPPLYVYTQRREPSIPPAYTMAPWDNYDAFYDLNIGWHEAPDPIRQSPFYSAGNKIHPDAQMPIVSNIAIGDKEAISERTFRIGKLLGYIHRPMYVGMQQPSLIRSNIQEAIPSTYGSQYEVRGIQPAGGVMTATGFTVQPQQTSSMEDGYPY